MATLFFRFPRLTLLVLFLIVAAGMGALGVLGRQEDPTLVERYGRVITIFPGADAQRVEALITEPMESALMELAELDEVQSTSRAGISVVDVSLREDLSETMVEQTWTKIRDQVSSVEPVLPPGVQPPEVVREYLGAATLIVALSWPQETGASLGALNRLALDLRDRLRNLSGTEETRIFGAPEEEIRVILDQEAAAALGLDAASVAGILAASDAKAPAGRLAGQGVSMTVEVAGAFDTLDRVRQVSLGAAGGQGFTRLDDIADVERGAVEPPREIVNVNGERTIMVAAYLQPGLQVDEWSARAEAIVAEFAATTPGAEVDILMRQAEYVVDRLAGLATNLAFSALIVFCVLFLMMGWRSALIVGSALPLTILLVLVLINLIGQPLHQMSVTGIVVALGLLIDNAIVVADDYRILRGRGMERIEAVEKAVKTLFGPLLASTLTTIFAFAPIALLPGSAGEFVGMIGVSVIFAVASSFVIAFTVVIALAAWFDDGRAGEKNAPFWRDGLRAPVLANLYRSLLDAVTARPVLGILIGMLLPIAGFGAATTLPSQFFPQTERDMFQLSLTLPSTASIAETERRASEITAFLKSYEEVEDVAWVLGSSPPRVYYNMFGGQAGRPNFAAGWVKTRSEAATRAIVGEIQLEARERFPDAQILTLPFEQGPPFPAPIEIKLIGPDLNGLDQLGDDVRAVLAATPGVTYTQAQMLRGEPVALFEADEAAAQLAGVSLSQVAGLLRADIDGAVGGSVLEGVESLPVRVIAPDDRRDDASGIGETMLPSRPGAGLSGSVAALGEISLSPEVASVERINGERANPIYGYLEPFTLPAPVLAEFLDRLDEAGVTPPPGFRIELGGDAENQGDAMGDLSATAVPLLILMITAVVLAFNSFRYAAVIFFVGVLSSGLAMFGVWMFGTPLGFNAIIGTLGLVGLSINGSIVVLSALKANSDALAGDRLAIRETVVDATRHILSTTFTTIGGFAPLLIEGDSFWLPFAAAVAGGVAGSAILALVLAPAFFVIIVRGQLRRQERREALSQAPAPA
ncbi:MAG: efflux RND transporter permease subunit [Pseudomonadota bacterium]